MVSTVQKTYYKVINKKSGRLSHIGSAIVNINTSNRKFPYETRIHKYIDISQEEFDRMEHVLMNK